MHAIDLLVVLAYALGITVFGTFFYRRAASPEGFMVARHRLPTWVVGMSIFATYLSSITFLALPGKAYAADWSPWAFSLSLPFAAWVAARWFVPLYRSSADVSAYAYLERRFGLWARLYGATFYLLTQIARVATILFLAALPLEPLTGWNIVLVIVVTGALVTAYTSAGGIEAAIWTDVVQGVILVTGAAVCVVILLAGMPQGPGQLFAIAAENGKFSLGSLALDPYAAGFWVVFVYGIFINLQNFGIDQSYVQRYQTSRSLPEARRSVWFGALIYIPVSALFLFIGTALFAYYRAQPELLPEALRAAGAADRVFPHFMVAALPVGLTGLLIAALFSAAQSTITTSINSSATVLLTDFYQRLLRRDAGEREQLLFLRLASIVLGATGTGVALLMISIKSALDAWWTLAGVFSGGMLGLFLLGALSRRAGSVHAAIGMLLGLLALAWATLSRPMGLPYANPFHAFLTTVIGTLVIFWVGIFLSRHRARLAPAHSGAANTVHDIR
jgi:SSS family solute:Na+ symporter